MSGDDKGSIAQLSMSEVKPNVDKEPTEVSLSEMDNNAGAQNVVSEDKPSTSNQRIVLRLKSSFTNKLKRFSIKTETKLGLLMASFCTMMNLKKDELRLRFNGVRVLDNDTPNSLGMINNDVIDIYQVQNGGGL